MEPTTKNYLDTDKTELDQVSENLQLNLFKKINQIIEKDTIDNEELAKLLDTYETLYTR